MVKKTLRSFRVSDEGFAKMLQGPGTNELAAVKLSFQNPGAAKWDNGRLTLIQGDFSLEFEGFAELTHFRTSTVKLLDVLTVLLTGCSETETDVSISIEEYMDLVGWTNVKEARRRIQEDLETLMRSRISWKEKNKLGRTVSFMDYIILSKKGISRGLIHAGFHRDLAAYLRSSYIASIPVDIWAIDGKNTNSYRIARRICILKNINRINKSTNEDIISVRNLLEASPDFPDIESTREKRERIIIPFIRDMDALDKIFKWEFWRSGKIQLSAEEQEAAKKGKIEFSKFIDLLVKISWVNYPKKEERIKKNQASIKRSREKTAAKAAAKSGPEQLTMDMFCTPLK